MYTKELLLLLGACITAFIFSFASTPIVERLAFKWKAIDIPKDGRRMHKRPIPRLGGLAIIFGFIVSVMCFGIMTKQSIAILVGAFIIAVMGIVDDIKALDAMGMSGAILGRALYEKTLDLAEALEAVK